MLTLVIVPLTAWSLLPYEYFIQSVNSTLLGETIVSTFVRSDDRGWTAPPPPAAPPQPGYGARRSERAAAPVCAGLSHSRCRCC